MSGTNNENFTIATYNVLAGNKISKLYFYTRYGHWFYGVNNTSSVGNYTFIVNTFYIKVYKNGTLLNTYTYNLNGSYSKSVNAYSTIDVKTTLYDTYILIDDTICHDFTTYEIKVSYSETRLYSGGGIFNHCGLYFNDNISKFTKSESVPSSITGITTTDLLTTNLLLSKGSNCFCGQNILIICSPTVNVNFYTGWPNICI